MRRRLTLIETRQSGQSSLSRWVSSGVIVTPPDERVRLHTGHGTVLQLERELYVALPAVRVEKRVQRRDLLRGEGSRGRVNDDGARLSLEKVVERRDLIRDDRRGAVVGSLEPADDQDRGVGIDGLARALECSGQQTIFTGTGCVLELKEREAVSLLRVADREVRDHPPTRTVSPGPIASSPSTVEDANSANVSENRERG